MKWIRALFVVAMSLSLVGCFDDEQTLVVNRDGSGRYERTQRIRAQMAAFVKMAMSSQNAESNSAESVLSKMQLDEETFRKTISDIPGARVDAYETAEDGGGLAIRSTVSFDDVNAFLASSFIGKQMPLRVKVGEGVFTIEGVATAQTSQTENPLGALFGDSGLGDGDPAQLVSQMFGEPTITLTLDMPGIVVESNGNALDDHRVSWRYNMSDLLGGSVAGSPVNIRAVVDSSNLAFELRDLEPVVESASTQTASDSSSDESESAAALPKPFDGDASVVPVGIQMQKAIAFPSGESDTSYLDAFTTPGATHGTTIAAVLHVPSGGLIAVDDDASRIESFVDDAGYDMLAASRDVAYFDRRVVRSGWQAQGANREYVPVFLGVTSFPSEDASAVTVTGTIVALRSEGTEPIKRALRLDAESEDMPFGPLTLHWRPGADSQSDRRTGTLTTITPAGYDWRFIQNEVFSDTNGEAISSNTTDWNVETEPDGRLRRDVSWAINTTATEIQIEITVYKNPLLFSVPFEIATTFAGTELGGSLPVAKPLDE